MSVFNRPMFRIPGMTNNQPSGIMASGPNIIRASLISGANNNPVMKANQIRFQDMPIFIMTIHNFQDNLKSVTYVVVRMKSLNLTKRKNLEGKKDPKSFRKI